MNETRTYFIALTTCFALAVAGCAPPAEAPTETETTKDIPKMKMTTDIPASVTAPDKVETSIGTLEYFDGVPTKKRSTPSMTISTARGRSKST